MLAGLLFGRGTGPDPDARRAVGAGVALACLDSTAFKALMPRHEIVFAGAFADVAAARELPLRLQGRGVEHCLKPADGHLSQAKPRDGSPQVVNRVGSRST